MRTLSDEAEIDLTNTVTSDNERKPFPMDNFEKALPYDPNKPKIVPAMRTYNIKRGSDPLAGYANPSNPTCSRPRQARPRRGEEVASRERAALVGHSSPSNTAL